MPAVCPTSRKVLLIPEATPPCDGRTTPSDAAAMIGLTIPVPHPPRIIPGMIAVQGDVESSTNVMNSEPALMRTRPSVRVIRGDTFSAIAPAMGATDSAAPVKTTRRSPAAIGEYPRMDWNQTVRKNRSVIDANDIVNAAEFAPTNVRFRNRLRSSIGCWRRFSMRKKAMKRTTDAPYDP